MTWIRLLGIAFLLCACKEQNIVAGIDIGPLLTGSFESECFFNEQASQGGPDLYTLATFTFNSDGTGSNYVRIFADNLCAGGAAFEATFPISFSYVESFGEGHVIHINQTVDDDVQSFYLAAVIDNGSYYADVDCHRSITCGPSETVPLEADVLDFVSDYLNRGTLLQHD
jgi:hypothetical protein